MRDVDYLEVLSDPLFGNGNTMSDNKNFKVSYQEFRTLDEARQHAKRATAKSFDSTDIWQKIETTVVPDIDIQINSVDIKVEAVKI